MSETWLDEPLRLFPELLSEGTSRYLLRGRQMGDLDDDGNPGGQLVYRFPNGLAASVVRYSWAHDAYRVGTYGATASLFEVAVGQFASDDHHDWKIVRTSLTGEDVVEGWQSATDVEHFLLAVKNLDPAAIEALG